MVSQGQRLTRCLKALSDTTRRGILELLCSAERSVVDIAEEFPVSRPAISKHLRILRDAGLVIERPAGRQRIYCVDGAALDPVEGWLSDFRARCGDRGVPRGRPTGGVGARVRRRPRVSGDSPEDWRIW